MTQAADGTLCAEPVATASCPLTDETVRVGDGWESGALVAAACGHDHRATFEYGSWALEALR